MFCIIKYCISLQKYVLYLDGYKCTILLNEIHVAGHFMKLFLFYKKQVVWRDM